MVCSTLLLSLWFPCVASQAVIPANCMEMCLYSVQWNTVFLFMVHLHSFPSNIAWTVLFFNKTQGLMQGCWLLLWDVALFLPVIPSWLGNAGSELSFHLTCKSICVTCKVTTNAKEMRTKSFEKHFMGHVPRLYSCVLCSFHEETVKYTEL